MSQPIQNNQNTNVPKLPTQAPIPHNEQVALSAIQKKLSGQDCDMMEIVEFFIQDQDLSVAKQLLIKSGFCTGKQFEEAIRISNITNIIGGKYSTATELLDSFVTNNNIKFSYRKQIMKGSKLGTKTSKQRTIDSYNAEASCDGSLASVKNTRRIEELKLASDDIMNVNDLTRQLRIVSSACKLHYTSQDINDVVEELILDSKAERRVEIYSNISYTKGGKPGPEEMNWTMLATSFFDDQTPDDLSLRAKIAAMQHFIWQVKRKMQSHPVENHMMMVLLGAQGTGKSTFINKLLEPLEELTVKSDFKQLTDDRNIDLWDSYVIVTDEMGWASRSDIDSVKYVITADTMNRRVMRTNSSVPVRQRATFIGASNREMNQLIRDETGARRFLGLRVKAKPDWDLLDKVCFNTLWRSIDERIESPIMKYMDEIKVYQEKIRAESSCELWANDLNNDFSKNTLSSASLYSLFRDWENVNYSKKKMDFDEWTAEMNRLMAIDMTFPFIAINNGITIDYMFIEQKFASRKTVAKMNLESAEKLRKQRNEEFIVRKIERAEMFMKISDGNYNAMEDGDVKYHISTMQDKNPSPEPKAEPEVIKTPVQETTKEVVDAKVPETSNLTKEEINMEDYSPENMTQEEWISKPRSIQEMVARVKSRDSSRNK